MRARVPSARTRGVALLAGRCLVLDKPGRDGTAKANLHPASDQSVWGVVYALDAAHWPALDACEGGYRRIEVTTRGADLRIIARQGYLAP